MSISVTVDNSGSSPKLLAVRASMTDWKGLKSFLWLDFSNNYNATSVLHQKKFSEVLAYFIYN